MGPFKCSFCERWLKTKFGLEYHLRLHQGVMPHKCSVCGKGYVALGSLKLHEKIHQGYKCSVCKKGFALSKNLKIHEREHRIVKPYKCSVCEKEFIDSFNLNIHERIHQGLKPYKCSVCDKELIDSFNLKSHERIHQSLKPYKCSVCEKEFIDSFNLKIHERIHQGLKSYKGTACEKEFTCTERKSRTHELVLSKEDFENVEIGIAQNLEPEENRVFQEIQPNKQILYQEPIDIERKVSVHGSEYTEWQANGFEFSEEILIEKEEIPFENEYECDRTCQTEALHTDESVYDNISDEEYAREGSDAGNDSCSSKYSFSKEGDSEIPKTRKRTVSDLVEREEDIYDKLLKRKDVSNHTTMSSEKQNEISKTGQTEPIHGKTTKGDPIERTKATYCSGHVEQKSNRKSDNEYLQPFSQDYRHLNIDTMETQNPQAETNQPVQQEKSGLLISKPNSSIEIENENSSVVYKHRYNPKAKPIYKGIEDMITRQNNSQVAFHSNTNKTLDILHASLLEFKVIDDWMNDMDE